MDWFATIVSTLLIAAGFVRIFRPAWAWKVDKFVGRQPGTDFFYKIEGFILFGFGIIYLIVFNFLAMRKH